MSYRNQFFFQDQDIEIRKSIDPRKKGSKVISSTAGREMFESSSDEKRKKSWKTKVIGTL